METMKKEINRREKEVLNYIIHFLKIFFQKHEEQIMGCKREMNSMQQSLMNMKKEVNFLYILLFY